MTNPQTKNPQYLTPSPDEETITLLREHIKKLE